MPLPFLVGLRPPDRNAQPVRRLHQVLDLQRHQFGAAERPAQPSASIARIRSAVGGAFCVTAVPTVRRMPRSVARTSSLLVGGSAMRASLWA